MAGSVYKKALKEACRYKKRELDVTEGNNCWREVKVIFLGIFTAFIVSLGVSALFSRLGFG